MVEDPPRKVVIPLVKSVRAVQMRTKKLSANPQTTKPHPTTLKKLFEIVDCQNIIGLIKDINF